MQPNPFIDQWIGFIGQKIAEYATITGWTAGLTGGTMSPTLIREAGYHIIMYYNDHVPAHVHVKRAGNEARVQIDPVKLMDNWGYDPGEVKSVLRLVQKHQVLLLETWKKFYPENDGESDE